MFLNNSLTSIGICNGTIGVILDLNLEEMSVRVAFCAHEKIIDIGIKKQVNYFFLGWLYFGELNSFCNGKTR